jgi:transcriptional regulator with XRE-family HTH domain
MKNTLCKTHEALDLSIKLLDLEVKPIAQKAGISESQISRYRNGRADISSASFARLIRALPEKARKVLIESIGKDITLEEVFFSLNE